MATSRSEMPRNNIAIAVVSFAITCAALPISCFHGDATKGGDLKVPILCVGSSNLRYSYKSTTACEFLIEGYKNPHAVVQTSKSSSIERGDQYV